MFWIHNQSHCLWLPQLSDKHKKTLATLLNLLFKPKTTRNSPSQKRGAGEQFFLWVGPCFLVHEDTHAHMLSHYFHWYTGGGNTSRFAATHWQRQSRKRLHVNNAGFKILKKSALQMFYEEGIIFKTFVIPQGYTQCFGECKHNLCLFTRNLHKPCLRLK